MGTEQWGRVDEDGTVWVSAPEGERPVGSYPGASPEEALAYFGRKYDEIAGQVGLLEQRVRTTDVPAKDVTASVDRLRATLAQARAVGDLAALGRRLDAVSAGLEERRAAGDAARAAARAAAREAKERLVAEAETLAESVAWKAAGERLRALVEEWKTAPRLERRGDDELWQRLRAARSTFDRRRRQHFAALDAAREEVRARKEKLVAEAESLAPSTDWAGTARRYRDLMAEWKAAGRADRESDDALWARFRAAQDTFFAARDGVVGERDAGQQGNLAAKEALAAEAERLLPVRDWRAARAALRGVQERWEAAGHVPREARDRVEGRLRRVEEAVRAAEQGEWRRANPEARARAEDAVAKLRAAIEKLERQSARAREGGQERAAAEAATAAAARREWLAEAERTLAALTR